jgi:hypothetical protein
MANERRVSWTSAATRGRDRFGEIQANTNPSVYFSFGTDMYGTKFRTRVRPQRNLYSRFPIYDYPYGYDYPYPYGYGKPPSGDIFAVDGIKDESSPSLLDKTSNSSVPIVIGGIVGAIAGYFVAKNEKKNLLAGALIGGVIIAGMFTLLSPSSPEERKIKQ